MIEIHELRTLVQLACVIELCAMIWSLKKFAIDKKRIFVLHYVVAGIGVIILIPSALAPYQHSLVVAGQDEAHAVALLNSMSGANTNFLQGVNRIRNTGLLTQLLTYSPGNKTTIGSYSPTERIIYVRPGYETQEVFQHELHHHLWYYRLTDQEREEWKQIYARTPATTEYGKTNEEEDFADTGAMYALNLQELIDRGQEDKISFFAKLYTRLLSHDDDAES